VAYRLFIVATARHGTGDAQVLNEGLEDWARANGAKWLRLGVVQGNVRAERYWESLGYIQTRTREGMQMGKLTNTVRVMVKRSPAEPSKSSCRWFRAIGLKFRVRSNDEGI